MNSNSYVLSIYGEADFQAINANSHQTIADLANKAHPGSGTFHLMEGTDHSMIKVGSMEKGVQISGTPAYRGYLQDAFNYDLVRVMDEWMREVVNKASLY